MELVLRDDYPLEESEKTEIDLHLDALIAKHKGDAEKINLWTMEAVSLATAVEARSDELENQGHLSRAWNSLTGRNQKLSARNQGDLARAQYLGQRVLSQLAEQNAITFEVAVAVGEKVNLLAKDYATTKENLAKLYRVLGRFFGQVRERIEGLEHEFRRNDDLLFWKETILEHKVYQNRLYSELEIPEKLACLVSEFLSATKGHWSSRDLAFLKSTMRAVDIAPEEEVVPLDLHRQYQADPALLDRLLQGTGVEDLSTVASFDTPLMLGFTKLKHLSGESKYLVDTLEESQLNMPRKAIELSLLKNYLKQHTGRSLEATLPAYDFVLELIGDLLMCRSHQEALRLEIESKTTAASEAQLVALRKEAFRSLVPQPAEVPFFLSDGLFYTPSGKSLINMQALQEIKSPWSLIASFAEDRIKRDVPARVSMVMIQEGQRLREGDRILEIQYATYGSDGRMIASLVKTPKSGIVRRIKVTVGDKFYWKRCEDKDVSADPMSFELFSFEPPVSILQDDLESVVDRLFAIELGTNLQALYETSS